MTDKANTMTSVRNLSRDHAADHDDEEQQCDARAGYDGPVHFQERKRWRAERAGCREHLSRSARIANDAAVGSEVDRGLAGREILEDDLWQPFHLSEIHFHGTPLHEGPIDAEVEHARNALEEITVVEVEMCAGRRFDRLRW